MNTVHSVVRSNLIKNDEGILYKWRKRRLFNVSTFPSIFQNFATFRLNSVVYLENVFQIKKDSTSVRSYVRYLPRQQRFQQHRSQPWFQPRSIVVGPSRGSSYSGQSRFATAGILTWKLLSVSSYLTSPFYFCIVVYQRKKFFFFCKKIFKNL